MKNRNSRPVRRVLSKVVRGPYQARASTQTTTLTHINDRLEVIARAYSRLGTLPLATQNDARCVGAPAFGQKWVANTSLQIAVDALRAQGIHPHDATVAAFIKLLYPIAQIKIAGLLVFPNEQSVDARRIAGRFRRLKR